MKTLDEDFPMLAKDIEKAAGYEQKSSFETLAAVNVNSKIEKKNGLSYLSWAWAVDQLLRHDPSATWEYREPVRFGDTLMVFCTVTAFGKSMTAQLPVMDYRNKAIVNPDSFAVNTAMQRCLAKAIALHGLGLYIYAGEDLPMSEDKEEYDELAEFAESKAAQARILFSKNDIKGAAEILNMLGTNGEYDGEAKELVWGRLESNIRSTIKAYESIMRSEDISELINAWEATPKHAKKMLEPFKDQRKQDFEMKGQ